ncbi:NUDIX domain-containing protein [Bacillus sp. EAC]|uniref:NUDIX hydrolase n=1 Tax=Bacillus sp. EAC TaxID=1978338 RepID=UPI000B44475E|nr:NUDIX domain-containing protein [Bacillus sp. EAC]
MVKVHFYQLNTIEDYLLKFAVIMARYQGKWIFVKHKERTTWEIPGGHREENESIVHSANRELIEETGAEDFNISPVCIYSVHDGKSETFGQLFYADVFKIGDLPNSEIGEINFFNSTPGNLTYPLIQPFLANKIELIYKNQ